MDDVERAARRARYKAICPAYRPVSDTDNTCQGVDADGLCGSFIGGENTDGLATCGVVKVLSGQLPHPLQATPAPSPQPERHVHDPGKFSYSQVSLASSCLYRWHLQYELKIEPRPGRALLVGKYFHGLIHQAVGNGPVIAQPEGMDEYDAAMTRAMGSALIPLLPTAGDFSYEEGFETVVAGFPFRGFIDRISYSMGLLEEHKTVGDMDEWSTLYVVQQTSLYLHAHPTVKTAVINLFAKPKFRPKKDEPVEDFADRCRTDMVKKPKAYYVPVTLSRSELNVERHVADIATKAQRLADAIRTRRFDRAANIVSCRLCDHKGECVKRLRDADG